MYGEKMTTKLNNARRSLELADQPIGGEIKMKKALIGKKLGMTQIFDENGTVIPVTVLEAGPCVVAQVKTLENDGYEIEDNIYYISSDDAFNAITSSYMKGYMNSPYWMIETDTYDYFSTKCIDFLINHTKDGIIEYIRKLSKYTIYRGRRMGRLVEFQNVKKTYHMGEVEIHAVDGVDFEINEGEFVVIVGPSGAGKTTVLNILGGMDKATSGHVIVDGVDISSFNSRQLTSYRRDDIGFVFQFYNLVQNLTALENVELALQICKDPLDAREVLTDVGLQDRMLNFPAQLSGGEQQRVAIARALAKNPKLLLCDEPTGALDYQTGKAILKLLQDTCRQKGMTVVVITHNMAIAPMADQVIRFKNGQVRNITRNSEPTPVEQIEW